jgi:hypothetical protein
MFLKWKNFAINDNLILKWIIINKTFKMKIIEVKSLDEFLNFSNDLNDIWDCWIDFKIYRNFLVELTFHMNWKRLLIEIESLIHLNGIY